MLDAEDASDSIDEFMERGFDGDWPLRVVRFYHDTHFSFPRDWGVRISDVEQIDLSYGAGLLLRRLES